MTATGFSPVLPALAAFLAPVSPPTGKAPAFVSTDRLHENLERPDMAAIDIGPAGEYEKGRIRAAGSSFDSVSGRPADCSPIVRFRHIAPGTISRKAGVPAWVRPTGQLLS